MGDAVVELVIDRIDIEHCDLEATFFVKLCERANRVDQARMGDDQVVVTLVWMLPVSADDRAQLKRFGELASERGKQFDSGRRGRERITTVAERMAGAPHAVAAVQRRRAGAAIRELQRLRHIGAHVERQGTGIKIASNRIACLQPIEHDHVDRGKRLVPRQCALGHTQVQHIALRLEQRGRHGEIAAHFVAAVPVQRRECMSVDGYSDEMVVGFGRLSLGRRSHLGEAAEVQDELHADATRVEIR